MTWELYEEQSIENKFGESPIFRWGPPSFVLKYSDFDDFYLEMVNGNIYSLLYDKYDVIDEENGEILTKQEVENYISFYKSLGFDGSESSDLLETWEELREYANECESF